MDLKYKHVEAALVDVARVKPKAVGAFRGKLRHLRNLGLPQVPSSGSGKHVIYSRRQVLEMLVAIELENIGHKPDSIAVALSQSIVRQSPYGQHEGKDCYIVLSPLSETPERYQVMYGIQTVRKFLDDGPHVFTLVNLSALVRRLDPAIERSLKAA
jgi:hypothetical protein